MSTRENIRLIARTPLFRASFVEGHPGNISAKL